MAGHIVITSCALDEWKEVIILRGVISPRSLNDLRTASYQREVMPESKVKELVDAMVKGVVMPDIELGLRSLDFQTLEGGDIALKGAVYIIDGLQRTTAARMMKDQGLGVPHLGCIVHFGTTEASERERFLALNLRRTKLSSNVVLRNMCETSPAVKALYNLSEYERTSPIFGRVCWQQRMSGTHFLTATQLLKVAGFINARFGPGRSSRVEELVKALDKTMENMGEELFIGNVRQFFQFIDECWDLRRQTFKSAAVYLRETFARALAYLLVEHVDFWDDKKLVTRRDHVKKMKSSVNLNDATIVQLAGSGGVAWQALGEILTAQMNSGRRLENRLKKFSVSASDHDAGSGGEDDEAEADAEAA